MAPQTIHWLEKLQVRLAAVAAAAVGALLLWPLAAPADATAPLTFLPAGQWGALAVWAGCGALLAVLAALMTPTARFSGTLTAALTGLAAMALRGGSMRAGLWSHAAAMKDWFAMLGVEALALAGVLAGVALAALAGRAAVARLAPRWAWRPPLPPGGGESPQPATLGGYWRRVLGPSGAVPPSSRPAPTGWQATAMALAIETVLAGALLALTFRSDQKGQVAFALAGSFLAATWVAHHLSPGTWTGPLLAVPLVLGAAVLLTGRFAGDPAAGPAWLGAMQAPLGVYLRAALPVHWLALGVGGAAAGLWASCRMLENKILEEAPSPASP